MFTINILQFLYASSNCLQILPIYFTKVNLHNKSTSHCYAFMEHFRTANEQNKHTKIYEMSKTNYNISRQDPFLNFQFHRYRKITQKPAI